MFAAVVDLVNKSQWRRQRDNFFSLVASTSISVCFGYWVLQVPLQIRLGYGNPSHTTWELLVENYLTPTIYPTLAILEILFVSHRNGFLPVELILVFIFGIGFVITDISRYALTKTLVYPIESRAFGSYWAILIILLIASFIVYRAVNRALLWCRRRTNTPAFYKALLYDSDTEEDSASARRKLINDDLASTIRYGHIGDDSESKRSCLYLSCPAIVMFVIIQAIVVSFWVNFMARNWPTNSPHSPGPMPLSPP